jgi:hypothetical protein
MIGNEGQPVKVGFHCIISRSEYITILYGLVKVVQMNI